MTAADPNSASNAKPASRGPGDASWTWLTPWETWQVSWDVLQGQWLRGTALRQLTQARLRDLARYAQRHAPHYASGHPDADALTLESLADWPVLRKADLMGHFDRVLTDPALRRADIDRFLADPAQVGAPCAGAYAVWTSSGTSGVPGIFVHDRTALARYEALQVQRFFGAMFGANGRLALPGFARYAMVAATGGHFAGASSVERLRRMFPWAATSMRVFSLMQAWEQLAAELEAYDPQIIASYPSALVELARRKLEGSLHIRPIELWSGGECLDAAMRAQVGAAFNARVREEYGASEFPSIAVGCPGGALHVNSDWVVLEAVDASYRPVAPGVASYTTLLTNLANRIQPLIRYDLGDAITWLPEPCACGNPWPALRVEGRVDDVLQIESPQGRAERLLPLVLTTLLEEEAGLYAFQLVQTGPRRLCLHVGPQDAARAPGACTVLRKYCDREGLAPVDIHWHGQLPDPGSAGGKRPRILRRIEQADEPEPAREAAA